MAVVVPIISTFDGRGVSRAIADFKKLDGAGQKTTFAFLNGNKALNAAAGTVAKFGAVAAGVAGVVGGKFVAAAYESQKVMKQTQAIITATGGAAGMTADQIAELSEKLSTQVGIDDELIQSSLNLLLTFKQVRNEVGAGNDIFNRAAQAALDLGNVFGSSDAAAVQLGKALSNPVKGVTALARAGINFTDQQKAQIKTLVESNNILGAQKIILGEVESQVGGTAAAGATAFDRMQVAIGNAAEDLGAVLIPFVEKFSTFVIEKVVPAVQEFAAIVGEKGIGAGIGFATGKFLEFTANMGAFGNAVLALVAALTAFKLITVAATIAQVAFNVALFANPIGIVVAAVIAFGVALVALAVKFKVVRDAFKALWNGIVSLLQFNINIALGIYELFINKFIDGANLIISGWNKIPFAPKVDEIKKVNLELDITALKIGNMGKAAQSTAAEFRKIEQSDMALLLSGKAGKGSSGGGGGGGATGLGKAVETAAEKFKKFADQARSVTSTQKSLRDALKNTTDAQKALQTATDKVAVAQEKLNKIASGYGAGSKEASDAQKELTDAQNEQTRASLALEKAQFAVTDAQNDLTRARRYGSPREIREAEIALEEAQLSLTDAQNDLREKTDAVTAAQTKLNETINGASTTSQTYKDALQVLLDAQDEQVKAIDDVRSAKERELEVTRNLVKAEILLRKAKGKLTKKQLTAANKLLADLNTPVTVDVPTASTPASTGFSVAGIDFSGVDFSGINVGGLATLASGGVVKASSGGTLALIGEGGEDEAVIPLSQLGSSGGAGINVYITAGVGDPNEIGRQVVNALQAYQRRNGAIPVKVQ
jgi:hypothetical protein